MPGIRNLKQFAALIPVLAFAGLLLAVGDLPSRADQMGEIEGTWEARSPQGKHSGGWWIELEVRSPGGRSQNSYGVQDAGLESFLSGNANSHAVDREAGTWVLTKTSSASARPSGTFVFTPNPEYIRNMAALGYGGLSSRKVYELASIDVTTVLVKDLASLGYDSVPLDRVIEMAIHDVDGDYIRGLAAVGYKDLASERLVEMRIHDVTPEYVAQMKTHGLGELTARRLVEMRIHDVTPEYLQEMAELGYANIASARWVEARIHDVTPEYVRALGELGYSQVPIQKLVAMRIHDVSPAYIQKVSRDGNRLSVEDLIARRIHG